MRRALAVVVLSLFGCSARSSLDGATDGAVGRPMCTDPTPIAQVGGEPSGFVECADGFIHRVESVSCAQPVETGDCDVDDAEGECVTDGDCTARPFGSCGRAAFFPSQSSCECHYGCATDADCGDGICACAGVVGERARCVPASCDDSADCGDGLCGLDRERDVCGEWSATLKCNGPESICRVDADCQEQPMDCEGSFNEIDTCSVFDGAWGCRLRSCGPCG